jgi:anaphase-promoting complex subunit 1
MTLHCSFFLTAGVGLQAPRRGGMDAEIAAQLHEVRHKPNQSLTYYVIDFLPHLSFFLPSLVQSHCFYVSGSALAVGIKYAGTHDMQAASSIASVIQYLLKKGGTVEAEIVDNCLGICALGLAVVLAGSGDMKAFRIIRSKLSKIDLLPYSRLTLCCFFPYADLLRRIRLPKGSEEPNLPYIGYGAYSALSQALGFLFLGGGECTFGQSIETGTF